MGIFSSTTSLVRYRVEGTLPTTVTEAVEKGLTENAVTDIDNDPEDKAIGWTTVEHPLDPDFSPANFLFGQYFIFSLRIDKKSIPAKIIKKYVQRAVAQRLAETGRESLSKAERRDIKERVFYELSLRVPAAPSSYELIWSYEEGWLWFLTTQKAANEALETLFTKSFDLNLIRLFGYTMAHKTGGLSPEELDALNGLTATGFRS